MKKKLSKKSLSFQIFQDDSFGSLTNNEQHKLLKYAHKRSYQAGEMIFLQDDPATGMYILAEGEVHVMVNNAAIGKKFEIGTVFGLFTFDSEIKRWYSLKAKTNTVVYGLFKPDFETIIAREPKLAFNLIRYSNRKAIDTLASLYTELADSIGAEKSLSIIFKDY
jgi:signal-transduction protein with cAMP-binding, CBS, and nucleotidyltransferase domain